MNPQMKARVKRFTPRHREVVRPVSLGCSNNETADILDLTPNTVDNRRLRAMKILRVDRATILTRIAIKHGISPLGDQLTRTEQRRSGQKTVL